MMYQYDCQFGLCHSHSTGDLLSLITHQFDSALDIRDEAHVVAVDISEAFDTVLYMYKGV